MTGPGDVEPQLHTYETPFVVIGRNSHSGLCLGHEDVSSRHAYLQLIDGRILCSDLHSRNGTWWENSAKQGDWFTAGESIRIGPYSLELCEDSAGFAEGSSWEFAQYRFEQQRDVPKVVLKVVGGSRKRTIPIHRDVTLLGSASNCDVRLRNFGVSKTHCSLVLTPEGLWVIDLLGRKGTIIDGREIRYGRLQDGDELQIGRLQMRVRYGESADNSGGVSEAHRPVDVQADDEDHSSEHEIAIKFPSPSHGADISLPVPAQQLPARQTGISESVVTAMMDRFCTMQQQMFQQSQQNMMMMVNMFTSLHRDHMALIREDLDRVHQITEELQQVQAQLLRQSPAEPAGWSSAPSEQTIPEGADGAVTAEFVPKPVAEPPAAAEVAEEPAIPRSFDSAAGATETKTPASESEDNEEAEDGVAAHAVLTERLANLQQERESRWQKIMHTLTGLGGA